MTADGAHPHPAELEADPPSPAVEAHLRGCAECRVERRLLRAGPPVGAGAAPPGLAEAARRAAAARSGGPAVGGGGPTRDDHPAHPRYQLGPCIGVGGSAEVFRAFDPELRRDVAVKVLTRAGAGARRRFLAEAQVAAQLDHPNIAPVFHLGATDDGRPFVVEREVRGLSLGEAVRVGRLPTIERRVDALRRVCAAVAYAHARGVLHRDLKPDNVMIGELGEVQVIDWGLARSVDPGPDDPPVHVDRFEIPAERTRDGVIVGTPAWMAPEQARGDLAHLDARTDVYGLGAILFFLLVGRPPVDGADPRALIAAVAAGRVLRPRDVDRRAPRELDAVVRRAMALRPEDRYPDVLSLLHDLDAWIERRPLPVAGSRLSERWEKFAARNRTTLRAVAATVTVAVLGAGLGVWRYAEEARAARDAAAVEAARARDAEREARIREAEAEVALADAARLDGRERAAAAALDRADLALAAADGDRRNAAWARSALVAANPPPVSTCTPTSGRGLRAVAVAPDGSAAVAVADDGDVAVWDPAGCVPGARARFDAPPVEAAAAWVDGSPAVVAWVGRELVHLRPGAGVVATVPLPQAVREGDRGGVVDLALYPWGEGAIAAADGQWWTFRFGVAALRAEVPFPDVPQGLALVAGGRDLFAHVGRGHIEARGLYDRATLALRAPYWEARSATSDGRRALVNARDGAHAADLRSLEVGWATPETPYGHVGVAPGDRVAWHEQGGVVELYDLGSGSAVGRVVAAADERLVAVGEDARLLLFAGEAGSVSARLRPAAPLARFAREVPAERGPRHERTADGSLLAVAGARGFAGVEVLDAATGVGRWRLPTGSTVNELAFSPDGRRLVASTIDAGLLAWDLASGAEAWRRPLPAGERPVEWVDDEVVFVDGDGSLVVLGGADGEERRRWSLLRGDSVDLVAVPGGRRVVVGSYLPEAPTAVLVDVDTGAVIHRLDAPEGRAQVGVSPDGRRAALAGWNGRTALWDLASGAVVHELSADSGPTIGVAFSPDGAVVVTSSWDEQLVFWDATTGARLRTVSLGRKGGFVRFTGEGSLLVTTWGWKIEELPLDAHQRHRAAVDALAGGPRERAAAFAALGWWERVLPELDRGVDAPELRARAALATGEEFDDRL